MSSLSRHTLNRLFSFGYMAKGVVYMLMGGLTLATVLGFGGSGIEGPRGVLKWVTEQPLGRILVGLLGVGLLCYASWRLYRAAADPTNEGHDAEGAGKRIGFISSGIGNGILALIALKLAFGIGSSSSGSGQRSMVADMLQESWGQWLIGLLGVGVVVAGIYQFYKAYKAEFVHAFHWNRLSHSTVRRLGRLGFSARGLVFGVIGYFLIRTAVSDSAGNFRGTEGALEWLANHRYGVWLLGLTSAGLLVYGVYAYVKGKYGSIADA